MCANVYVCKYVLVCACMCACPCVLVCLSVCACRVCLPVCAYARVFAYACEIVFVHVNVCVLVSL